MISVLVEPFVALNDLQMLVLARRHVIDPRASFMSHISVATTHIFHHVYETNSCSFSDYLTRIQNIYYMFS